MSVINVVVCIFFRAQ